MPRKLRIQHPGAIYQGMSRGDRRDKIFLDDVDRLLGEHGIGADGMRNHPVSASNPPSAQQNPEDALHEK
jgi:hypothetical protein